MPLDKRNAVPSSQYRLLVTAFVVGSSLLLSFIDNMVRQDAWLVVVISFLFAFPFLAVYVLLAKKLPGKNLMEINDAVFGPVIGKIMSLLYLGYFFILISFNVLDMADFYIGSVMRETPKMPLIAIALAVAGYGVCKGIRTIAKAGFLSVAFTIITILATSALLIKDMDLSNFLPVMEAPKHTLAQSIHIFAALPYCEAFVLMMVMPSVGNGEKVGRTTLAGAFIGMLLLLLISVRNTAVLGPTTALFATNSYMAVRLIDVGEFFTRVELFVAISLIGALFIKVMVLLYAMITGFKTVFGLKSATALIVPVGGLITVLATIAFSSTVSHAYAGMRYHAFFPLLFEFILPPVTLLVACIRKLPGDGAEQEDRLQ